MTNYSSNHLHHHLLTHLINIRLCILRKFLIIMIGQWRDIFSQGNNYWLLIPHKDFILPQINLWESVALQSFGVCVCVCWCWEVGVFLGEIKFFFVWFWTSWFKCLVSVFLSVKLVSYSQLTLCLYIIIFIQYLEYHSEQEIFFAVSFHNIIITVTKWSSPTNPKRNNL